MINTSLEPRKDADSFRHGAVLLLVPAILIGATLRCYRLTDHDLWGDEGASLAMSSPPTPRAVVAKTMTKDAHPPGYYLALHFWQRAFGSSDAALRGLSVFFGVLTVPAVFLVGSALFGSEAGAIAALLVAIMPLGVRFSQETRSYALLALLSVLAWYFAVRLSRRRDGWAVAGFTATAVALPYTHYYGGPALLAAVVIPVVLLMRGPKRRALLWQFVPGVILAAVLFAPWITTILRHQMDVAARGTFAPQVSLSSFAAAFGRPFGHDVTFGVVGVLSILTTACSAAALLYLDMLDARNAAGARESVWWAVGMLVLPLSVIAVIGGVTTFWVGVRVPNITMAPVAVVCAAALVALWPRLKPAAIVLGIVLLGLCTHGLWHWYAEVQHPEWAEAVAFIAQHERPGDVIVTLDWRYVALLEHYYSGPAPVREISRFIDDPDEIIRQARNVWPRGSRMWLILKNRRDSPAPGILRGLASGEECYRIRSTVFCLLEPPDEDRLNAALSQKTATAEGSP